VGLAPFRQALERLAGYLVDLQKQGIALKYLDFGGGLGVRYTQEQPASRRDYARVIAKVVRPLGVELLLEPGRAIIGPAGVLIMRVVYRKRNDGKQFVIVDAAMNDLIRPSLYNALHEIVPVVRRAGEPNETVDIVGPICESGDFFARGREIRHVEEGDLLAILDAGAYGMSLASNYNTRPRAAEVLVDGKRARLIRRRESINDLLAGERV